VTQSNTLKKPFYTGQEQAKVPHFSPNIACLMPARTLRCSIIEPTLCYLGVQSECASNLMLGTLLAMAWLPTGKLHPEAIGPYGITPAMHTQLWDQYLAHQPDLASLVRGLASQRSFLQDPHAELAFNLAYATAIAWMIYQSSRPGLLEQQDLSGLASLWQQLYPHQGGLVEDFLGSWDMNHASQSIISA